MRFLAINILIALPLFARAQCPEETQTKTIHLTIKNLAEPLDFIQVEVNGSTFPKNLDNGKCKIILSTATKVNALHLIPKHNSYRFIFSMKFLDTNESGDCVIYVTYEAKRLVEVAILSEPAAGVEIKEGTRRMLTNATMKGVELGKSVDVIIELTNYYRYKHKIETQKIFNDMPGKKQEHTIDQIIKMLEEQAKLQAAEVDAIAYSVKKALKQKNISKIIFQVQ
jgi:hypothetical protein